MSARLRSPLPRTLEREKTDQRRRRNKQCNGNPPWKDAQPFTNLTANPGERRSRKSGTNVVKRTAIDDDRRTPTDRNIRHCRRCTSCSRCVGKERERGKRERDIFRIFHLRHSRELANQRAWRERRERLTNKLATRPKYLSFEQNIQKTGKPSVAL